MVGVFHSMRERGATKGKREERRREGKKILEVIFCFVEYCGEL